MCVIQQHHKCSVSSAQNRAAGPAVYLYSIDQCTRDVLSEVVKLPLPVGSGSSVSLASFGGTIEHLHRRAVTSSATSASRERPARQPQPKAMLPCLRPYKVPQHGRAQPVKVKTWSTGMCQKTRGGCRTTSCSRVWRAYILGPIFSTSHLEHYHFLSSPSLLPQHELYYA